MFLLQDQLGIHVFFPSTLAKSLYFTRTSIGATLCSKQLVKVKDKIRKKLRVWASVKLSLAGRVVVVNHILLATMWHLVACWVLDKTCIKNIKAMVRGFLWSGRDHERASAKVAWSCLIKAKNQGGLGLVDPTHQSKALLGKLLVRSLQPGLELWKMLLRDRADL